MATWGITGTRARETLAVPLGLAVLFVCGAVAADARPVAADSLIQPGDLVYVGAFRLPDTTVGLYDDQVGFWSYSGYAMTYFPDGDPDGPDDGFRGSLFAIGHDQTQFVAEISIPEPVASREVSELNVAGVLQEPCDIIGGVFEYLEMPRAGLEYLPARKESAPGRIHYCWGQHLQDGDPSHGWFELDLASSERAGPWLFGSHINYVTNDYLFEIPESWASENTPGARLATGRFRDGVWSGLGPALFAYDPPDESAPPARGERIESITPLLLYGTEQEGAVEVSVDEARKMTGFGYADEWSGGAWLTSGDKAAVVLVGTKGTGKHWYGFSNGVEYPMVSGPDTVYPEVPDWPHDARGFWSEGIEAQVIFFDPGHLAAVAKGEKEPWEPQPYATLSLDRWLYDPGLALERAKRFTVGATAFDRERGYLFVAERLVAQDDDRSVIHVWKVD